jgi:hypothetical protein
MKTIIINWFISLYIFSADYQRESKDDNSHNFILCPFEVEASLKISFVVISQQLHKLNISIVLFNQIVGDEAYALGSYWLMQWFIHLFVDSDVLSSV